MLFHARGSAPCIPGAEPKRRREQGRTTRPAGGVPGWSPARPAAAVPGGGACLLCRLPTPPLASLSAPYPPPPFPGGEGGDQGFFMQGAPPLASLGLNPSGAGSRDEPLARRGACPAGHPPDLAAAIPGGGRACFVACCPPAFSLLSCPLSPRPPSPAGKGVTKVISCKGLRPLHPWHLIACGTYRAFHTGSQRKGACGLV